MISVRRTLEPARDRDRVMPRTRWRRSLLLAGERVVVYLFLIGVATLFLLPFYWMLATAFRPQSLVNTFPPELLTTDLTLDNFRRAWDVLPFDRFFVNTFLVTSLTVAGTIVSSSLAGYGFARFRGRGSTVLFVLMLATMMLPPTTTLVPRFVMFSEIGWTDSYLPLVVPAFFASPFFVFLFRQFFRAIPREYFDAAEIDGASPLRVFLHIAVPMARPAFLVTALFATMTAWNDFMDPLVFLNTLDKFTIQLGLATFKGQNYADLHLMMPMALLAIVPVLILVVLVQRAVARGIAPDVEK